MAIDYKARKRYFAKGPKSTEMVPVPRDVFDFMLETFEAFCTTDGGNLANVVSCQFLVNQLMKKVLAEHDASSTG